MSVMDYVQRVYKAPGPPSHHPISSEPLLVRYFGRSRVLQTFKEVSSNRISKRYVRRPERPAWFRLWDHVRETSINRAK